MKIPKCVQRFRNIDSELNLGQTIIGIFPHEILCCNCYCHDNGKKRIIHSAAEKNAKNDYFPVIIEQTKLINVMFCIGTFLRVCWALITEFGRSSFEIDTSCLLNVYEKMAIVTTEKWNSQ